VSHNYSVGSISECVRRARTQDAKALTELYRMFWRAARAAAYGVTGNLTTAEDAAVEGLDFALVSLDKLRDPKLFAPWLRRIVIRTARRHVHARRRTAESALSLEEPSGSPSAEDMLERREIALLIRQAVETLPTQLREAIALHYFEGFEVGSGARFLNVPVGTFKRRLHEGRLQLGRAAAATLEGRPLAQPARARLQLVLDEVIAKRDEAGTYRVIKLAMEIRPFPRDLVDKLVTEMNREGELALPDDMLRSTFQKSFGPPPQVFDPVHPLGSTVRAISEALVDFERWQPSVDEGLAAFRHRLERELTGSPPGLLPPGFAQGRPGKFLRLNRGMLHVNASGRTEHPSKLIRQSDDWTEFRAGLANCVCSTVADLFWLEARVLQSAEVEALLVSLVRRVLPSVEHRVGTCLAPRYRVGIHLELGDEFIEAAIGGVLPPWPGQPEGTELAHVRLYVEAWAEARTGVRVEMENFADFNRRR